MSAATKAAAVTVVSAYYPIQSKFPPETYVEWIRGFWPKLECRLLWFCQPDLVPFFAELFAEKGRAGTVVIYPLPFSELAAFQRIHPQRWVDTAALDPERGAGKHTPELYALWFEKKEFIRRAMEANPFKSQKFVWCDAGICRHLEWVDMLRTSFPQESMIPSGKMLVLQIDPFREGDTVDTDFTLRNTVGGGILASDCSGWVAWYKAYDTQIINSIRAGRFIGKDQNIMAAMIVQNPQLAIVLIPPEGIHPVIKWFFLLFYLAGIVAP